MRLVRARKLTTLVIRALGTYARPLCLLASILLTDWARDRVYHLANARNPPRNIFVSIGDSFVNLGLAYRNSGYERLSYTHKIRKGIEPLIKLCLVVAKFLVPAAAVDQTCDASRVRRSRVRWSR